jgi:Transcriptional regulator, AbiEi antitoxin, Type IV TA system
MTQVSGLTVEREVRHELPDVLAALLDEPAMPLSSSERSDLNVDLVGMDTAGRRWLFEVKASSRADQVARAAAQLLSHADRDTIPVLVVPYMTPGGAEAADRVGLNWIDLSGNARVRAPGLHIRVQGHPNQFPSRGRPSSAFAPKSARIARALLLDPSRWWRQKDLVDATGLNDGNVSRVTRRLNDDLLLEQQGREFRPRDPDLLLDAWANDYRFSSHDIVTVHYSGNGIELARTLDEQLTASNTHHAFTGLPAAWLIDEFARFRLTTVYVDADPRDVAAQLDLRRAAKGANVQLVGPNDVGVFAGESDHNGVPCVSPVQVYLDLLQLPERATDAAEHLRAHHLDWQRRDG